MKANDIHPSTETTNTLSITCKNDYNIVELRDRILNILDTEKKKKTTTIQKELHALKESITKEYINRLNTTLTRIHYLENELSELSTNRKKFTEETEHLIQQYNKLRPLEVKKVFGKKTMEETETLEKSKYRHSIISEFFLLANKYITLDVSWVFSDLSVCERCNRDITTIVENNNDVEVYCPDCGLEIHNFKNYYYEEASEYEDLSNFEKRIDHYEGKEKIKLDPNLFPSLDKYFQDIGIPVGQEIRDKIPKNEGRRNHVINKNGSQVILTRNDLRKALGKTDFQDYYKNINLICHQYWGWDLPCLDEYREKLIDHYKKTESILKKIKNKDKKATINTDWRLENHLKILNVPYKKDDFKHIDTRNILEYYDQNWEIMCQMSGDPEIVYIKTM